MPWPAVPSSGCRGCIVGDDDGDLVASRHLARVDLHPVRSELFVRLSDGLHREGDRLRVFGEVGRLFRVPRERAALPCAEHAIDDRAHALLIQARREGVPVALDEIPPDIGTDVTIREPDAACRGRGLPS